MIKYEALAETVEKTFEVGPNIVEIGIDLLRIILDYAVLGPIARDLSTFFDKKEGTKNF